MCGTNNCRSSLGFPSLFDCCYKEEDDFCTIDSPCGVNEGDCDYVKSNYKPTREDKLARFNRDLTKTATGKEAGNGSNFKVGVAPAAIKDKSVQSV